MTVKSKIPKNRTAHERAITKYIDWMAKNPGAPRNQRYHIFDLYVDREDQLVSLEMEVSK